MSLNTSENDVNLALLYYEPIRLTKFYNSSIIASRHKQQQRHQRNAIRYRQNI